LADRDKRANLLQITTVTSCVKPVPVAFVQKGLFY